MSNYLYGNAISIPLYKDGEDTRQSIQVNIDLDLKGMKLLYYGLCVINILRKEVINY
jgi:hypothetical protein